MTHLYKFDGIVIWMPEGSNEPSRFGFFADPRTAANSLRYLRGLPMIGKEVAGWSYGCGLPHVCEQACERSTAEVRERVKALLAGVCWSTL